MKKTYCLDTNVLIHDPHAVFSFDDNFVVVPEYVLLELDKLKEGNEERNHSAREASRLLRGYFPRALRQGHCIAGQKAGRCPDRHHAGAAHPRKRREADTADGRPRQPGQRGDSRRSDSRLASQTPGPNSRLQLLLSQKTR